MAVCVVKLRELKILVLYTLKPILRENKAEGGLSLACTHSDVEVPLSSEVSCTLPPSLEKVVGRMSFSVCAQMVGGMMDRF